MSTLSPGVFNFGSQSSTVVGKVAEALEEQTKEVLIEVSGVESKPYIQQEESVKSLPLILVSRVMKGVPQSPHFWPLRDCSDLAKRLLIDAWDRVFEESADKIQNMRGDGFFVEAKKLWKTMEELQGMGYNVIVLRRRLIELTEVLMEKRGFKREIAGLMERAEFHRMEKNRLEYEILQIKARVEAEKMRFDDLVGTEEKMEVEYHGFDAVFRGLVIKPIGSGSD